MGTKGFIQEATLEEREAYRRNHPERLDLRLGNATCTDSDNRICENAFRATGSELGRGAMTVMDCGIWVERLQNDYSHLAEDIVCGALAKEIVEGAEALVTIRGQDA